MIGEDQNSTLTEHAFDHNGRGKEFSGTIYVEN